MNTVRLLALGTLLQVKQQSRSPLEITISLLIPLVQATLAVYLFQAGANPPKLLLAAVGAGMMGVWSSVLFGSGTAVQNQRFQGTLEILMITPTRSVLKILPITLATGLVGLYSVIATLVWGVLLLGVSPSFASPVWFALAAPVCVLALGAFGLLLASTFVLLRNANAIVNPLGYPVWLLSGMLVPITALPAWTGPIAAVLPTTWGARALRTAVTGGPVWPALAVCVGEALVALVLGTIALHFVERRARVTATLALT